MTDDADIREGSMFDGIALELFSGILTEEEIAAGGRSLVRIDDHAVQRAEKRVLAADVLDKVAEWRREDRHGKRAGGRPPMLDDRQILIMSVVLISEGTPLLVTEVAHAFQHRLTDNARARLGVQHLPRPKRPGWTRQVWYQRTWRSLRRLIDTMDAWPAPRVSLTREERVAVFADRNSLRTRNLLRRKMERSRWFTNAMLEMTLKAQPKEVSDAWRGHITVDQTSLRAPSQQGPWAKHEQLRVEVPRWYKDDGTEVQRWVSEIDATTYPKDKSLAKLERMIPSEAGKKILAANMYELGYAANFAVQVGTATDDPDELGDVPRLIVAASLGRFGGEVAEQTLAAVDSLAERGRRVTRATFDRGYSGGIKAEEFHVPMAERGIELVIDYNHYQKGVHGQVGGAPQVEGGFYCPATPQALLNASVDFDAGEIDERTYWDRIDERLRYKLHAKERPDENGSQPLRCPALGPSATVVCPKLRPKEAEQDELQRKARRKRLREGGRRTQEKVKIEILDRDLPHTPDRVCCNSSISVKREDGIGTRQALDYGTSEWAKNYRHDRNSVESINNAVKNGKQGIGGTNERRLRGLAGQAYIFTMLLVAWNLRHLAAFLRDKQEAAARDQFEIEKAQAEGRPVKQKGPKPQRLRDRENRSNYTRRNRNSKRPMTADQLEPPSRT